MTTKINYLAAAFELFAGFNMIFSPAALLDGYTPSAGFETLAFEWFGCCCVIWGLLLACNGSDRKIVAFNILYQGVWVASLGSSFYGKPWRPQSAVADGSWAFVPFAAHSVFFLVNVLAYLSSEKVKAA
jgi:hypothetical protein